MPYPFAHDIVGQINAHGFTYDEISKIIGVDKRAIGKWREGVAPYPRNMERLVLLFDITEAVDAARAFMFMPNHRLADMTPGEYLLKKGSAAREELMLLAKNYVEARSYADTDYVLMHVRLDMQILQSYNFDKFDLSELINKDRGRIDELMNGTSKKSHPTPLEARQFRQAAATAIFLNQSHSPGSVKRLMFRPGVNYRNRWMSDIATKPSIVEIIASQTEGDTRGHEVAAFELSQALKKKQ